ncbi:MAG: protein-glutamate O-methyltransferase CheR, partial [Candidatus Lustribacter sp.]
MSWSEPEFAAIAMLITQEFGVAFPPARRTFAENAIRRASGFAHEHSLERYRERLTAEPPLLRALIAEVTVGETYFFRDPAQFDAIRTIVLPDLLQRRSSHAALRIWSAGCATGEEAYSLAILTADGGLAGCTLLLGTDVSNTAIDVARRGQYGAWSFRHDAAGWRERGFTHTGKHWTVAAAQRRVEFAVHNLMHPAPELGGIAGGFDLILCRNVLLYFDRETVERAARGLVAALAPGGWLLTSPTDPLLPSDLGLETVPTPAGLAYRKPAATFAPAVQPPVSHSPPRKTDAPRAHPLRPRPHAPSRQRFDAEAYVARALAFLDGGHLHQAAA